MSRPALSRRALLAGAGVAAVGALVVADGRVFVGDDQYDSGSGRGVRALDSDTGRERWREAVNATSSCVVGPTVYALGAGGERVTALDATTGEVRWSLQFESAPSSLAAVGSRLFVGTTGGRTYALAAE